MLTIFLCFAQLCVDMEPTSRRESTGDIGLTADNIKTPIPIGGTSSDKYAQLIILPALKWAYGFTHEGFIVYNVYDS